MSYTKAISDNVKYIEDHFLNFFKSHGMIMSQAIKEYVVYKNSTFGFKFYYETRHMPMAFEGITVLLFNSPYILNEEFPLGGYPYNFDDIVNFMQNERGSMPIDKDQYITTMRYYASCADTHIAPFLAMYDGELKLRKYIGWPYT